MNIRVYKNFFSFTKHDVKTHVSLDVTVGHFARGKFSANTIHGRELQGHNSVPFKVDLTKFRNNLLLTDELTFIRLKFLCDGGNTALHEQIHNG